MKAQVREPDNHYKSQGAKKYIEKKIDCLNDTGAKEKQHPDHRYHGLHKINKHNS